MRIEQTVCQGSASGLYQLKVYNDANQIIARINPLWIEIGDSMHLVYIVSCNYKTTCCDTLQEVIETIYCIRYRDNSLAFDMIAENFCRHLPKDYDKCIRH